MERPASRLCEEANMPYDRLKPILDQLEKKGLVTYRKEGKARIYRITKEGLSALRKLEEAYSILKAVGIEK